MTFDENSFLVKLYVSKIQDQGFDKTLVPKLFNLYEVVNSLV